MTASAARTWWIVAVMVCAQSLIWLDGSILNIAMATLADPSTGLGASSVELEWMSSLYNLLFASVLITGGALADRFGPRATLLAGLVIFAASSAAGAYAGTPTQLIVARGVMGVGSALILPSTLSIILQCTPVAMRARAIAVWGSSAGVGVAIGPASGGLLLTHFWWGSVFLVNVPIVAVCLVAVVAVVPAVRSSQRRALDLPGLFLSVAGFGGVVYAIIEAGQSTSWSSARVLVPLFAGGVLITAFLVSQHRSAAPSLDLRLFAERRFAAGSVVLLLAFGGLSGQLFFAAFYLQGPLGLSPQAAGMVMIAAAVGVIMGSMVSPTVTRLLSARSTVAAGMLTTGMTYASFLWFDQHTPVEAIVVMLFVQGLGMGVVGAPMTTVMMDRVPAHLSGVASAVRGVTRQLGSTIGVATTGSILAAVYRHEVTAALPQLSPRQREEAEASVEAARSLAATLGLPGLAEAADRAFLTAMRIAAVWTTLLAVVGFVVAAATLHVRARHRADDAAARPGPTQDGAEPPRRPARHAAP